MGGSAGAVVNTALPITPFCFSPVDLGEGDAECNIHVSEMPTVWGQAQKISWLRGFCFGFVAFGIETGMFCHLGGLVTKAFLLLYFLRYSLGMEKGTDSSSAGTVRFAVCARGKEQSWAAFSSMAAGSLREDPASLPSHLGDGMVPGAREDTGVFGTLRGEDAAALSYRSFPVLCPPRAEPRG